MISATDVQLIRDGKTIIDNFSFDVQPGKVHALLGPNGSGKSTALSALAGDSNFYKGTISYDDNDVRTLSIKQLAKLRAVVSQSQRFGLGFSVRDILQMATSFSGTPESINSAIEAVNIQTLLDRTVISLSGGEQQRVTIAMAFAQSTKYLLLDEPFSAQDVGSVARITAKLRELADSGVGVLLVAHMSKEELTWCDSVTQLPTRAK